MAFSHVANPDNELAVIEVVKGPGEWTHLAKGDPCRAQSDMGGAYELVLLPVS